MAAAQGALKSDYSEERGDFSPSLKVVKTDGILTKEMKDLADDCFQPNMMTKLSNDFRWQTLAHIIS